MAVKSGPMLPGGKRADLAFSSDEGWTYVEVKTRTKCTSKRKGGVSSFRQGLLREISRLTAHSLEQLPKKEPSLVVLVTSVCPDRREAVSKIAIARSFTKRIFDHDSQKLLGLMIFAPFRARGEEQSSWKYASALILNPNWKAQHGSFDKLARIQL